MSCGAQNGELDCLTGFQIESVLKIAPYHTLIFGGIGKLAYLCTVVQRKACAPRQVNIQHSTFNIKH